MAYVGRTRAERRSMASAGVSARTIGSCSRSSRPSSQVPRPITGRPILRARAISERVPNSPAHRDHGIHAPRHDRVPRLAEPGGDRDREVRAGALPVVPREDPDRDAAGRRRPVRRRVHDAAEPPTDEHVAGLGEETTELLGGGQLPAGGVRGADDGHVLTLGDRHHRVGPSLVTGRVIPMPGRVSQPGAPPRPACPTARCRCRTWDSGRSSGSRHGSRSPGPARAVASSHRRALRNPRSVTPAPPG